MAENANARAADPGAAAHALGKEIAAENSTNHREGNEQGGAKRRCPGCARRCRKLVAVQGWHTGREALICQRCAAGLVLFCGRVMGLKLAPEARP